MIKIAIYYLVIINLITFITYGVDKLKAKKGYWRIPESTLFLLAFVGGSMGAWLGMQAFHHKTLHKKFKLGIPLILMAQVAFALYIYIKTGY